jgi:hypothetical protein
MENTQVEELKRPSTNPFKLTITSALLYYHLSKKVHENITCNT